MTEEKPTVYIFHGNDTYAMQQEVRRMEARLGDPSTADLNLSRLDGNSASEDDLRTAVSSIPFLAERRMVIFTHPLAKMQAEASRTKLLALLESIPQSTALVLLIQDEFWRRDWETWQSKHWLYKWAQANPQKVYEKLYALPVQKEMPGWVLNKARELGGKFTPAAAARLAEFTGPEPYIAAQEIEKLLAYANYSCTVEPEDVEHLSILTAEADIFKLTDAIAEKNVKAAQVLFRRLLQEREFALIYGLIVRQFRLLLAARETLDERGSLQDLVAAISDIKSTYIAEIYTRQARRFSADELVRILRTLLELDYAIKSGSAIDGPAAMDVFIVKLAE